jgi:hypothetical protein
MDHDPEPIERDRGDAEPTLPSETASLTDDQLAPLAKDLDFDSFRRLLHILAPKFNLLQLESLTKELEDHRIQRENISHNTLSEIKTKPDPIETHPNEAESLPKNIAESLQKGSYTGYINGQCFENLDVRPGLKIRLGTTGPGPGRSSHIFRNFKIQGNVDFQIGNNG